VAMLLVTVSNSKCRFGVQRDRKIKVLPEIYRAGVLSKMDFYPVENK